MQPTLETQPIDRANLTPTERDLFASYVSYDPIASHQREAEQARIAAFPRLLAAYSALDTALAEGQGYCEELSRALDAATARIGGLLENNASWQKAHTRERILQLAATARATKAESRVVQLLAEFVAGIQPADIPGCLKMHSEPAFGEFLRGMNAVHGTNLRWARWKAAEFGLPWPLPAAEFEFGYTNEAGQPEALPAPLPSSPAAAGPRCEVRGIPGPWTPIVAPDSQLPFDPGFTPKCHGCGLSSHVARCKSEDCPAKEFAATTTGEGKEVAGE